MHAARQAKWYSVHILCLGVVVVRFGVDGRTAPVANTLFSGHDEVGSFSHVFRKGMGLSLKEQTITIEMYILDVGATESRDCVSPGAGMLRQRKWLGRWLLPRPQQERQL
jgi:hypothetical protein